MSTYLGYEIYHGFKERKLYLFACDECGTKLKYYSKSLKSRHVCPDCKRKAISEYNRKRKEKRDMDIYNHGKDDMRAFVEQRCKELGIDYTLIFSEEVNDGVQETN